MTRRANVAMQVAGLVHEFDAGRVLSEKVDAVAGEVFVVRLDEIVESVAVDQFHDDI